MARLFLLTPSELSRDPRARRAAFAALARGHDVVGVCGRLSGEEPVPLPGVQIVRAGPEGRPSGGERVGRRDRTAVRELRGVVRLARVAVRTARLARAGRRAGRADVVHANDLDTLSAGWLLARGHARLVYDAHELYSEFEVDPPRIARRALLALERALARRAHAVVTVSEALADELVSRLLLPARPLVVLNAPVIDRRDPQDGDGFVYQGAFGPGRPLSDLLRAVELAPAARLTIRVVRVDPEAIRAEVHKRGLEERVTVAEPLSPDRLLDGLRGFGAGIVFDRPATRNSELSLPNKLFEYLMAGLAVVAPRLPALTPLVEGEGVGLTYEPGRPEALADALERLARDETLLDELRRRARHLALERLNAEAQAETLTRAWGL